MTDTPTKCEHEAFRVYVTPSIVKAQAEQIGVKSRPLMGKCLKCNAKCMIAESDKDEWIVESGWFE
jgi:hypothetical protein